MGTGSASTSDELTADQPITCALVDPQPVYVEGLIVALRRSGISAVDAQSLLISSAESAAPPDLPPQTDAVVLGVAGADALAQVSTRVAAIFSAVAAADSGAHASAPIVVLADSSDPLPVAQILRAGVSGIVDRASEAEHIAQAIRSAVAGQVQIDPPFAARLAREVAATDVMPVSPREFEVLQLMADGLGNQQIADRLFISLNTVKNHIRSIHEKLGVRTRTAAVSLAVRQGWVRHG